MYCIFPSFIFVFVFHSDIVHNDDSAFSRSASGSNYTGNLYHSHSNPDLVSLCYEDVRGTDYPEHVLKVYKSDQTCKYLLVHKVQPAHLKKQKIIVIFIYGLNFIPTFFNNIFLALSVLGDYCT